MDQYDISSCKQCAAALPSSAIQVKPFTVCYKNHNQYEGAHSTREILSSYCTKNLKST